jgi:predicted nucleic acid-binding protein
MNTYALDTNTVSYLLNKNQKIIKKINDVKEYILVSNNTKHFSSIDTLQVENWA